MNAKILLVFFALIVLAAFPAAADEYAAISQKLKLCAGCHGEKGASSNPEYPILAGQHLYYLYVQLKDFKSGFRKNDIMSPLARELDKADMLSLAKYFSEQKWPRIGFSAEKAKAAKGETAAAAGQCVQCHLGGYEGNSRIPRLAGQFPKYLNKTMRDFKNKVRTNSPAKSSLMVSYDDADIEAMSNFLGNM